jgi:ATP-dependent DNA ligase
MHYHLFTCPACESHFRVVWLRPEAVAQIEFLGWTAADRLWHSKFVGLREDKDARRVVKEQPGTP